MAALSSSIKLNLKSLYNNKSEFDWLMTQKEMSVEKMDRLAKLKKEMSYSLSCILSVNSKEVLSNSFYTSVNIVEQGIINLINQKEKELDTLEYPHNKILADAKRVISSLYLIDILQNNIHIITQNEEKLIELKNVYLVLYNSTQRQIALEYILNSLEKYTSGIKRILELTEEHKQKDGLSMENKQEIYNIIASISFDYNKSKIRNKIYGESSSDEGYINQTRDFLKFYEDIFLELVSVCKVNLHPFYKQIEHEINKIDITPMYINSRVKFIYKKYSYDLQNEITRLKHIKLAKSNRLKKIMLDLIGYTGVPTLEFLVEGIKESNMLPSYLENLENYNIIYDMVLNTDFLLSKEVHINTILDELSNKIIEKFVAEEYIKGYKYNQIDVVKQLAHFRQYFISLLETSKNEMISENIEKIERIIAKSDIKKYNLRLRNKQINDIKSKIKLLEHALRYINENFRDFGNVNLKLYINSIQRRYYVEDLYETLEKNALKNSYPTKVKKLLKKEREYLNEFVNKKVIQDDLVRDILDNCIYEDEELKKEVLEAI